MNIIKAPQFSLTVNTGTVRKNCLAVMIGTLLVGFPALACGPEYDALEADMLSTLPFDPAAPKSKDSFYIFEQFIESSISKSDEVDNRPNQKQQDTEFLAAIGNALSQNGKKITAALAAESSVIVNQNSKCNYERYSSIYDLVVDSRNSINEISAADNKAPDGLGSPTYQQFLSSHSSVYWSLRFCKKEGLTPSGFAYELERWHELKSKLIKMSEKEPLRYVAQVYLVWGSFNYGELDDAKKYLADLSAQNSSIEQRRLADQLQSVLGSKWGENTGDNNNQIDLYLPSMDKDYYWGRCQSNNAGSIREFASRLGTSSLDKSEVIRLTNARFELYESCASVDALTSSAEKFATNSSSEFDLYLQAAANFYLHKNKESKLIFDEISKESTGQLRDLAAYMNARISLIDAQPAEEYLEFYESPEQQEEAKVLALASIAQLQQFIRDYPASKYVASAKGLMRRGYWLVGDNANYNALLRAYSDGVVSPVLKKAVWQKSDTELLENTLVEYWRFASFDATIDSLAPIRFLLAKELSDSNALASASAPVKRLTQFIALVDAYKEQKYARVVDALSAQVELNEAEHLLLLRALEVKGDWQAAIVRWRDTIKYQHHYHLHVHADYEIARIVAAKQGVEGLFLNNVMENALIKQNYLASLCDIELQKKSLGNPLIGLDNKHLLFADIAKRYLYNGDFASLQALMSSHTDELIQEYAAIRTAVKHIVSKQKLGAAYMNVGYFMKVHVAPLHHLPLALQRDDFPETCEQTLSAENKETPYSYFNKAMPLFNSGKDENEAKTLHFLTLCGKGGIEGYSCTWGYGKEGMTSEAAFKLLHRKYANSNWAEKTPYHY